MEALRYKNLFKQIERNQPKTIVEIGVYDGQHAYEMIKFAQRFTNRVSYYGFDLFESITPAIIKEENSKDKIFTETYVSGKLNKTGCSCKLYKGFTRDTLPPFVKKIKENKLKIDFVFIDGGHSLETIKNDWLCVREIMHEKTVVLFDDYYQNRIDIGCKCLIDLLVEEAAYKIEVLQPIDIFKKGDWDQKTQMVKVML